MGRHAINGRYRRLAGSNDRGWRPYRSGRDGRTVRAGGRAVYDLGQLISGQQSGRAA
jgi:hypothetical protein